MEIEKSVPVNDLLYAYGSLCEYAYFSSFDYFHKNDAERLRDVINSFQRELRSHLVKDTKPFIVSDNNDEWIVEPEDGWKPEVLSSASDK